MARPRMFSTGVNLKLGPIERCLVAYYVRNYRGTKSDILRTMTLRYSSADKSFGPDEFLDFVRDELVSREAKDEEEARTLLRAATRFVAKYRQRHDAEHGEAKSAA